MILRWISLLTMIFLVTVPTLAQEDSYQWTDYTSTTVPDMNFVVYYPEGWTETLTEDELLIAENEADALAQRELEAPEEVVLSLKWLPTAEIAPTLQEAAAFWLDAMQIEEVLENAPFHAMTYPAVALRGVDEFGRYNVAVAWFYQDYGVLFRMTTPDEASHQGYLDDFIAMSNSITLDPGLPLDISFSNSTEGVNFYMYVPTDWDNPHENPGTQFFEMEADSAAFKADHTAVPTGHVILERAYTGWDWDQLAATEETPMEDYIAAVAEDYGIQDPQIVAEHVLLNNETAVMIRGYSEQWNYMDAVILPRPAEEALLTFLFSAPTEEAQQAFYPTEIAVLGTLGNLE